MKCFGCGAEIDEFLGNHKCDAIKEAQIEGARRASDEQIHSRRELTFNQRLSLGFDLMDPEFWR